MKKFFGILSLFFCVILASCNFNNLSGKTGSLEFSIPLNDIIQMSRQTSNRSGGGERSDLLCLVQVKGDKGYYVSKTIPQNIKYSDSATENYSLDVPFYNIPVGQTYTVMFDMLVIDDQNGIENLYAPVFSGKSKNVVVSGGKTSEVNIKAEYIKETCLSLKIDFTAGGSKTLKGLTFAQMEASYEDENSGKTDYWELEEQMIAHLSKQNGKLFYSSIDGGQKEVKDIYYVLESNSNFIGSSFKYKIYYTGQETKEYSAYDLNFKNNVCSLKDYLLSQKYFYSSAVVATKDNFIIEFPATCISYFEDANGIDPFIDPSIFEAKDLQFVKVDEELGQPGSGLYRYVCVIPLSQIALADSETEAWVDPSSSITDGKALAITLSTDYNDTLASVEQFYYMLQPDNYSSIDLSDRYTGNNCIIFAVEDYLDPSESFELTLPINNLTGTDTKKNLMLGFDKVDGASSYTIPECSLMSVLYPEGTAIFATSRNYDYSPDAASNPNAESYTKNPWRFELKYPLGELSGINTNDTLTVKMSGTVSVENLNLRAEVFDAIGGGWDSISTESVDGNRLYFTVNGSRLNGDSDSSFIFKSVRIIKPDSPGQKHDFYLQCTSEYGLGPDIIAIKNFNVSTELETPVDP